MNVNRTRLMHAIMAQQRRVQANYAEPKRKKVADTLTSYQIKQMSGRLSQEYIDLARQADLEDARDIEFRKVQLEHEQ